MYGKSGVFPSEYVHPVAAPDFLVLPDERVEPRHRQGRVAASAAVAVAMGSAVAAHELDLSTEVCVQHLCVSSKRCCFVLFFVFRNGNTFVKSMEFIYVVLPLVVNVCVCVCQVVNEVYGDSLGVELDDLPLHSDQYHMTEFAKKYFRDAQKNSRSDFTLRVQV